METALAEQAWSRYIFFTYFPEAIFMKGMLCCMLLMGYLSIQLLVVAQASVVDGNVIIDQPMHENLCALTFDDGPSANTPQLLDMLAEYGVPATFFLLGKNAERYPALVRRIVAEGHEVGNHSYSHPNLRSIGPARKAEQLQRTDTILRGLGAKPIYIRPPYGSYDDYTVKIAEKLGASLVLWSLDSRDWKRLPDNYATLRSTRGTVYAPGTLRGVFLFHDTHAHTVEDLPRIIRDLRAGGCQRFVTISDYLEGLVDPEPGLHMIRAGIPRPAATSSTPAKEWENINLTEGAMRVYPAGTAPLPMGRSSVPWQVEGTVEHSVDKPQTIDHDLHEESPSAVPVAAPAS